MTKQSYKNKKLNPADIAYEVNELIRKNNLDIKFIKTERKPHLYKSGKSKTYGISNFDAQKIILLLKSLSNFRKTSGCRKCSGSDLSIEERISELRKVHGDIYDYSLFQREGYINSKSEIPIRCTTHGIFRQVYTTHKWVQDVLNVRE